MCLALCLKISEFQPDYVYKVCDYKKNVYCETHTERQFNMRYCPCPLVSVYTGLFSLWGYLRVSISPTLTSFAIRIRSATVFHPAARIAASPEATSPSPGCSASKRLYKLMTASFWMSSRRRSRRKRS